MKINDKYEISPFGNAFDSLFSLLTRNDYLPSHSLNSSLSEHGNVRIREEDKKVIIEFLVPGWKKNDLLLSLDEQKLTLTSAIKNEKEQNSWFQNNNLNFEIQLGQNLDTSKTNAKLEEGVLTVSIPVSQKTKGRNIKIS
ncbi:MAG: Hsp20 family protein [Verrucomicrobiota bacterium]|nr:Hsp20 family protein [Verrucomicrobiota bacterium]